MRTSPGEIERQISETHPSSEEKLEGFDLRAASDSATYGRVAMISLAVVALAGAGYLVYRRVKRPALAKRLRTRVLGSIRDFPELRSGLRKQIAQVKVVRQRRIST
jgi:hypothetical protein